MSNTAWVGMGAFTRAELLDFIKLKARTDGGRVVTADGKTLIESLRECGIDSPEDITIDKLDVAANACMFHRFDNFNDSYTYRYFIYTINSCFMHLNVKI